MDMIRTVGGLLVLLALTPALAARDKAVNPATPAEQYKAILAEYAKAMSDYRKAMSEAKPQDRQKVMREKQPKMEVYAARLLELAEKNPKDSVALDALLWVAGNSSSRDKNPESPHTKTMTILTRDHVRNDKIDTMITDRLRYDWDDATVKFLREVLAKNPKRETQGKACLQLAQQADARLEMAQDFKDNPDQAKSYESFLGKKTVEELVKADLDKLSKEAQALYERVAKDFGDLSAGPSGTMKNLAEIKLEALRHPIVVGKLVPEIEGEDIDGKKFKLSDYRGKAVLLDFWGNW
jgi:hypothetical protein